MKKYKDNRNIWGMACAIAVILFVVLGIVLLTGGNVTTSGKYPEAVSDESLVCNIEGLEYPFFTYDFADRKTTEVKMIFAREELKSVALVQNMYYHDANTITGSEAHNHAAMNKSFANNGLKVADAYNAKYTRLGDRMQMSLYITADKLDSVARKYFLMAMEAETMDEYKKLYENQGFECKIVKD